MAVLDRQRPPESLFREELESRIDLLDALGTLQAFSMITKDRRGGGFTMHRFVQIATQRWLEVQGSLQEWQEKGLKLVSDKFPSGVLTNWIMYAALQPHARVVLAYSLDSESCSLLRASLLAKLSRYDHAQGRYEIAENGGRQAIAIQRKLLGKEDPATLQSINNLAVIYSSQSRYKEAEALQLQMLDIQKARLGEEHPFTLRTISVLAQTYEMQGLFAQAELLIVQVLETHRKLGTQRSDLLPIIHELMIIRTRQGHYREAGGLGLELLELQKEHLGKYHPSTLKTMEILGTIYLQQGQSEKGSALGLQLLEIRSSILGKDHPETLGIMKDLANIHFRQGHFREAVEMHLQILEICRRVFGESHKSTLGTMQGLVSIFQTSGQFSKLQANSKMLWICSANYLRSVKEPLDRSMWRLLNALLPWPQSIRVKACIKKLQ